MIYKPEVSNIHASVVIPESCVIHAPVCIFEGVKIGERVKVQAMSFIPGGVTLEDDVFVGPGVVFTNDKYPPSHGKGWKPTLVKKGASIGAGAIILPGITVGENAKVGAGSVVTKDVEPNVIVMGNPAHLYIKKELQPYRNPHD